MDNTKMGEFIASRRKTKGLTQRELAKQLGVTDKAVSKWERGLSCPDISLLSPLSDILEITISELLNGTNAEISETADVESIVETTLQYADTVTKSRSKNIRSAFAMAISAISILGIVVCLICNFAITGNLTWAWFPISSLVYLWLVTMPLIAWGKRGVCTTLISISLLTIPFLLVLEKIIGIDKLIMPIGLPVFIAAVIYLWAVYLIIDKTKWPKYIAIAVSIISGSALLFGINYIVSKQTGEPITDIWDIISYCILIIISTVIFGHGYIKSKYRK